jgi:cell division protein FtsL
MAVARQLLGIEGKPLYTPDELQAIQTKLNDISRRISERSQEINKLATPQEIVKEGAGA